MTVGKCASVVTTAVNTRTEQPHKLKKCNTFGMCVMQKCTARSAKWKWVQLDMQEYTHSITEGHTKKRHAVHVVHAGASASAKSCPHTTVQWHRETNENVIIQSHIKLASKHLLGSAGPNSVKLAIAGVKYLQIMHLGMRLFPLQNLENITRCKLVCAQ